MMMTTMTIISTMTSKTMMRCSRPSVVLARPDCTRQSHSTSSSVIFDRDNDFDDSDNCETGDDDAMQMERPGALPSEVAAAWTLISFQRWKYLVSRYFLLSTTFGPARNVHFSFNVLSDLKSFGCKSFGQDVQRNAANIGTRSINWFPSVSTEMRAAVGNTSL